MAPDQTEELAAANRLIASALRLVPQSEDAWRQAAQRHLSETKGVGFTAARNPAEPLGPDGLDAMARFSGKL